MKMRELINILDEAVKAPAKPSVQPLIDRTGVLELLKKAGYDNVKVNGNKLQPLVQIPDGQLKNKYRQSILANILQILKKVAPKANPRIANIPNISSAGVIIFDNSPVNISVKDVGQQADKSAGKENEFVLDAMMASMIEKYGSINVTFVDTRGKSITIHDAVEVESTGGTPGRHATGGIKKADVVLRSKTKNLPISIKELSAASWESAEGSFGAKARKIIDDLLSQGAIKLDKLTDDLGREYYRLNKEIVVEPTEEESMRAIFGTDINPEGGIVIQDFKPHHFKQEGKNITVECHTVIKTKADIPESHLMVWRIGNSASRPGKAIGYRGLRPQALTLKRALGTRGTKDVVLVDKNGNLLRGGLNQTGDQPAKANATAPRARRSSTKEPVRQRR